MWLLQYLVGALLATLGASNPVQSSSAGFRPRPFTKAAKTLITGVQMVEPESHVGVRREIRDLKNNFSDMWNLYILGLRSLMLADETNPVSYYEIAGIHGRPYRAWEGAEQNGGAGGGYCPHTSSLFFGWHRPYLALFEQELFKHVSQAAESFHSIDLIKRFAVAANQFRMPYWDWAMQGDNPFPDILIAPTVEVLGFSGLLETIPNPLYSFEFHPNIPGDLDKNFAIWNSTIRWPTSNASDALSQNSKIINCWNSYIQLSRDTASRGFVEAKDFNSFSKDYIENAHGNVHYIIGGLEGTLSGHMWPVEISAFDPVFMLHHCNVDRLVALWQVIKPDIWITPAVMPHGTFTIADGTTVDADTPLAPFWKTESTFWTANDCRDTTSLGYVYPETTSWEFPSPDLYKASVNATISRMYSMSARKMLAGAKGTASAGSLYRLLVDKRYQDWSIKARASPVLMPYTFVVRFYFIGDFSSDPVVQAGVWSVLTHSTTTHEHKTKRASTLEQTLTGSIGLTASLLDQISIGKLDTLDEREIVPYLTEKLTWKVFTVDGQLIPHDQLGGLTVEVVSTSVYVPEDENMLMEMSEDVKMYPEITLGKGGVW